MNKECTYLVSSTDDYTAMDGGLLHNKLIVIAGHNYVLVKSLLWQTIHAIHISQSRDLTLVDLLEACLHDENNAH